MSPDDTPQLRRMSLPEFANRMAQARNPKAPDQKFAFFLGAGCSIDSGIPAAGVLVRDKWLPRLQKLKALPKSEWDTYLTQTLTYSADNPASSYGRVMDDLFPTAAERQAEIEDRCAEATPSFGYAVLAQIIAGQRLKPDASDAPNPGGTADATFNVVLTTNFDDLLVDALNTYTDQRPLVIHHSALAEFIRPTRTRPLIVKLHGDAKLAQKNTTKETSDLEETIRRKAGELLHDRGIVFIGYGGNDESIQKLLESLPKEALPWGIYWLSSREPSGPIRKWMVDRQQPGCWVEIASFETVMLQLAFVMELSDPKIFADARNEEITKKLARQRDEILQRRLAFFDTVRAGFEVETLEDFYPWLSFSTNGFDAVEAALRDRVTTEPKNPKHLGNLASFLAYVRKNESEAEHYFKQALETNRTHARNLAHYGSFLTAIHGKHDEAEEYYKRAIEVEPNHPNDLNAYATFLCTIRNEYDTAEKFYKKAIAAAPTDADILGNYANFLKNIRGDHSSAEEYYKRALEADPKHANNLGNYAIFLTAIRGDHSSAEEYYKRALEADPKHANILGAYAIFLQNIRGDHCSAEEYYKRALEADPKHATNLGAYAIFLKNIRGDHSSAEEYYKRALEADPKHANILGNYAIFLTDIRGDHSSAEECYKRAIEADPKHANILGNYAEFLQLRGDSEADSFVRRAIQAASPNNQEALRLALTTNAYLLGDRAMRDMNLRQIRELVESGHQSATWNFAQVLERAKELSHPAGNWAAKLADVVTGQRSPKTLNRWAAWQHAAATPSDTPANTTTATIKKAKKVRPRRPSK